MVKNTATRPFLRVAAGMAVGVLLAGCVNFSALDDLALATPTGSPFNQALFADYAFVAHSFGNVGQASYKTFDQQGSMSLANTDSDVAALANAFAQKAVILSHGEVVDPEPSTDVDSHNMRDRLVRALASGRDTFPRDAARAQTDFDCWRLNASVPSQASAALQCRRSLDVSLTRLENETQAATAAAEAAKKPAPAAAQPSPDAAQPNPAQ